MTTELTGRRADGSARRGSAPTAALSKVPEVTLIFWITKILTTGMGETTSDFLNQKWDPKIMVSLSGLVLAGVIWVQFKAPRYSAWIYWAAVVMVSVFGTMCADVLHVAFGVPYAVSTAFFAIALAAIFVLWYRVEGTLSIHSITTPRRELFYWLTVVTTFALGTAVGDLTATTLKLGYFSSGVMFAVLFAVPAVAYKLGLNGIVAFWFAYVVTRPFGASFADWMGVSVKRGGLAWGTGPVSLVLLGIIVVLVAVLAVTKMDVGERE
ncbi:hypothetical protein KGQ20_13395 [Catenulispora sp. NF23]|uniref:COG4705 family protein n=1 Tax=Catenulispora pinistramenti TaxID=2705254 RepID=UPI001BAAACB1|nr:hypothetical protein [Catenulispora pinistramenti]MBS2533763.1 hypothetical protein [Catenulispora pinistramenti]